MRTCHMVHGRSLLILIRMYMYLSFLVADEVDPYIVNASQNDGRGGEEEQEQKQS